MVIASSFTRRTTRVEDAGVRVGAITAYRLWSAEGHRLFSVTMRERMWRPGAAMTGDPSKTYEGVYAFRDLRAAVENLEFKRAPTAVGAVKLWGQIVEHEHGYRAENAKIVELYDCIDRTLLPVLRSLYLRREFPENAPLLGVFDRDYRLVGVTAIVPRPDARVIEVLDERENHALVRPHWDRAPVSMMMPTVYRYHVDNVRYPNGRRMLGVVLGRYDDPVHLPEWLPL